MTLPRLSVIDANSPCRIVTSCRSILGTEWRKYGYMNHRDAEWCVYSRHQIGHDLNKDGRNKY